MKFAEWVRDRHPESVDEGISDMVADARRRLNSGTVAKRVNRFGQKATVFAKRAGEKVDRALGDDPHMRQASNRQRTRDAKEFGSILGDD